MFTVLIAEKEHIDAIRQGNKLFFEPFLENKELAFCYWNPAGQNLDDSVPGLLDAVGRRKEWRAVIINNCNIATSKLRNPFDVVEHSMLDSLTPPMQQPQDNESIDEWEASWKDYYHTLMAEKENVYKSALELPLQKLATWLCFRPEDYVHNEVQEKQDVYDWAMEKIGRDDIKLSAKIELLEREQYKCELRLKEKIRRIFVGENYLNVNYPSEVYCISPRAAENNYFDPDAYWNIRQDTKYSTFADRNMYFDRMRFMVFDMLSPSHRNFRSDYIRFLATVLIFISNAVPSSAMKARRLYQLEVETDDEPLCTLATSYDRKLANTYDVIGSEMEKIRSEIPGELTDKAAEALFCTPKDVDVLLDDSCDTEKVYVEKDYGLFFDTPENEYHKWNRDYNTSKKELLYIVKQQSRSVRKSVGQMHLLSEMLDVNVSRLTALQIDDVREYTNTAEDVMVESIPTNLTDASHYIERMTDASEAVNKAIARRMTRETGVVLSIICLSLFFICFLPFLLANNGTEQTITTAIIMSGASLGSLAIILLVSLFVMRASVLNEVRGYNNTVHEIVNDIHSSMKQFSKYLSASCVVRRGHAVQNYAEKNLDEYTKSLRIRKKHQEDIRRRRAYLEENYSDYLGKYRYVDETMSRPYEYDFEQTTEFSYPAPFLAGDTRQIDFISNGNLVTVPSSFVTRIIARMEGIYEK